MERTRRIITARVRDKNCCIAGNAAIWQVTGRGRCRIRESMATADSILSFPDRGPWGDPGYRGNCSGHVYRQIFEALRPRVFTDPTVEGGTSVEVAREMGIEAHGLDLHSGFNILKHRILELSASCPTWCFRIRRITTSSCTTARSGAGQGTPTILSRCATEDEFLEKLTIAVKDQRHATRGPAAITARLSEMCAGEGSIPAIMPTWSPACRKRSWRRC